MKTARQIRSEFIDYFVRQGHTHVQSSPLIPQKDPTLLFTNAGMVQFKDIFLGNERRKYTRAVSVQKCMRAGGKHNDLENVGVTGRHHTFFEMLGNFSFGDYFKDDAIRYAWELLTDVWRLPKGSLWVTVYEDDDEAYNLWKKIVPEARIVRMGAKDNFWQMGETGPCGPCSEILIDQGEGVHRDCPGIGRCDCDRYLEIWNLVFMQYDRDASGNLTPLPKPSIDTGMGLERITAVVQGVYSNYDTDLFTPIFEAIGAWVGKSTEEVRASVSGRVIADHLRSMAHLISDGVLPSNEGRGYVLRRIIRRAARHGRLLGQEGPFLHGLVGPIVDTMSDPYAELARTQGVVTKVIRGEEERFSYTLSQGMEILGDLMARLKSLRTRGPHEGEGWVITGSDLFKLYDTYGFPLDLATEIARDEGFEIDLAGFERAMEEQRQRARRVWGVEEISPQYQKAVQRAGLTEFVGYDRLEEEPRLLAILRDNEAVRKAVEGEEVELIFDRTPFYAESGGQIGDRGWITHPKAQVEILDTQKPIPQLFVHRARVVKGMIEEGERCHAQVDVAHRKNTSRNHTATHVLHAVLREVLGDHVKQAGSLVAESHLRFDFSHFTSVDSKILDQIEEVINGRVRNDLPVYTEVMDIETALSRGALAFFGEKYGGEVRVVEIADFSKELCGGTHCRETGEVALFKIIRESSVAAGVRRIEALTGEAAYRYAKKQELDLRDLAGLMKVHAHEVLPRAQKLLLTVKEQEREIEKLREKLSSGAGVDLSAGLKEIGGIRLFTHLSEGMEMKELRAFADRIRDRFHPGVLVVGAPTLDGAKGNLVAMVTTELSERFSAAELLREIAPRIGGSGGGRPEMAQAGGKEPGRLADALAAVEGWLRKKMT
ncbi:MAG TPA: alanine--tRNA ligase [Nitrospiria bacterium]|nr:alanine--tRNA ligase [Nitrospiria bacterium]